MFKFSSVLFLLFLVIFVMDRSANSELITQCEKIHNVSQLNVYLYYWINDSAPSNIKEYILCEMRDLEFIQNGSITNETIEFSINSVEIYTPERKTRLIAEYTKCLDTEETALYEQVIKFIRCIVQGNKNDRGKLSAIIANCETKYNITQVRVHLCLSNNASTLQNVEGYILCELEGRGFIQNGSITNETVEYSINSTEYFTFEEKTQMIGEYTKCLDTEEADLNQKVIKLLQCVLQRRNIARGKSSGIISDFAAYDLLVINGSVPEIIMGYILCEMEGHGFIVDGLVTNETVKTAIHSSDDYRRENKARTIIKYIRCLDTTETNLHEQVLKLLRCIIQKQKINETDIIS